MAGFGISMLGMTAAAAVQFFIPLCVLAAIGSTGLFLLPAALIRRANAKREGRVIPNKMYVTSLIFTALPQAVITVFLWVYAIFLLNQYTV
ncbi:MAG: hypothetical protein II820_11690 [Ruminiclostridium sp.]|nr:hypothetical protein [Ruminiclostridium sp.]